MNAKANAHRRQGERASAAGGRRARGKGEDGAIAVYCLSARSTSSISSSTVKIVKTSSSSSSGSRSAHYISRGNNNERVDAPDLYDRGLRAESRRCVGCTTS